MAITPADRAKRCTVILELTQAHVSNSRATNGTGATLDLAMAAFEKIRIASVEVPTCELA